VVVKHVAQKDPLGCMIAATAMALDLTYEQVAEVVPLQDLDELQRTGCNALGLIALSRVKKLAKKHGKKAVDIAKPFSIKPGIRYLGMVLGPTPLLTHAVTVDEFGTVFDPDASESAPRKSCSEYEFLAMLEFRPLSQPSGI
jgi:hypothetical protein